MKNANKHGPCLTLLIFLSLAGCGTSAPERPAPASSDAPLASSTPSMPAPLAERLGTAIRSAGPDISDAVKVTGIDGIVLLTGEVLSEEAKSQATNTAVFIGGSELRRLTNELRVVDAIDTASAEQDKLLAASVESLLADSFPESASRLKSVVDKGRVYLLGQISREQGDAAAELVGRLQGVEAITTVFLYTD